MKKSLALLAGSALLFPGAVLASPAEAASGPAITSCSRTKHGVTVRIKLRDEGTFTRVRVSHPQGIGNFKEPAVKWTRQDAGQIGGGESRDREMPSIRTSAVSADDDGRQNSPSFRIPYDGRGTAVYVLFKLRNGKRIDFACVQQ